MRLISPWRLTFVSSKWIRRRRLIIWAASIVRSLIKWAARVMISAPAPWIIVWTILFAFFFPFDRSKYFPLSTINCVNLIENIAWKYKRSFIVCPAWNILHTRIRNGLFIIYDLHCIFAPLFEYKEICYIVWSKDKNFVLYNTAIVNVHIVKLISSLELDLLPLRGLGCWFI